MQAAQRFALAASGRDADKAWKQDSAEALKLPENAANPTCRLHAVLGGLSISLMGLLWDGKHPLQYQYTWYQCDVQPEPPQLTWW